MHLGERCNTRTHCLLTYPTLGHIACDTSTDIGKSTECRGTLRSYHNNLEWMFLDFSETKSPYKFQNQKQISEFNLQSLKSASFPKFDWTDPEPECFAPWRILSQKDTPCKRYRLERIVRIGTMLRKCTTMEGNLASTTGTKHWQLTRFLTCACGTMIGASSCWLRISPRLPIVKTVLLFFREVFLVKRPRDAVSSIPIRSSFVTDSSNFNAERREE